MAEFPVFPRDKPLPQELVDEKRLDIWGSLVVQHVKQRKAKVGLRHVRFLDRPSTRCYVVRKGNPPPDSERKPWEKGLRLEIDVGTIHPSLALFIMRQVSERRRSSEASADHLNAKIQRELRAYIKGDDVRIIMPDAPEETIERDPWRAPPEKILRGAVSLGFGGTGKH